MNRKPIHGYTTRILRGLIVAVAMAWLPMATAVAQELALQDIKYTSLPGDRVQLRLQLSAPPAEEPLSFTIDNPARIALDFPGTRLGLENRTISVNTGAANSVSAVEAGGRTRVVLNLVRMVGYDVALDGSAVVVTIDNAPASLATTKAHTTPAGNTAAAAAIRNIDFRRGERGEGLVQIELTDPSTAVNIGEEGGQIVVEFANVSLPDNLDRKIDVLDFATPVREFDTKRSGNGARMAITPLDTVAYEHLAYQTDNLLTVEIKPLTPEEVEARKAVEYTGEKLSLNFQNIEVRAVLQLLADFTGFNMVASDTVNGNVTLRLKNVPWDQAMDIILKSKGLAKRENGNVVLVAPQDEIANREKLELEGQKLIRELAPLRTEYVQVNYAKASDLATLIKSEGKNLISERGNVSVDERTNTLLLQETAEKLTEIRKLVTTLDIPVRQVLIESRIVLANEDFSKDVGVKFGYSRTAPAKHKLETNDFLYTVGGKRPGDVDYGDTTAFHSSNKENYIVDLPVAGPAGALQLAVGKFGSYLLQLELSALQAEGKGEIISSPKVITANQKEAVIEAGSEIPYQEATSSGAT